MTKWFVIGVVALAMQMPTVGWSQDKPRERTPDEQAALVTSVTLIAQTTVDVARTSSIPTDVSAEGREAPTQLALVISGGASLGTYQAGMMHFTTEVIKRLPDLEIRMLTGASAGSANALISLVNSCRPPQIDPLQDIGFRVWSRVGYSNLFQEDKVTRVSVFTRDPMNESAEFIWAALEEGLREDCDMVLGVTTTRVEAKWLEIVPGLSVPNQTERWTFRIQGRGYGQPPKISNYQNYFSRLPQPLLPFDADNSFAATRKNFELMRDAVFASMAFPIAFAPVNIGYCPTKPYDSRTGEGGPFNCTVATETDQFVDGGVYDNNPLQLALRLERRGLRLTPKGKLLWKDADQPPDVEPFAKFTGSQFVYIDPDTFSYPREAPRVRSKKAMQLVDQAEVQASNFVQTSRSRELFALINDDDSLRHRMRLTQANYPTMSEHVGAFMGLLEYDFRFFDFYLGMYDGLKITAQALERRGTQLKVGKLFGLDAAPDKVPVNWKPFACLVSIYEPGYAHYRPLCQGEHLRNFRTLAQVSLDRVYTRCAELTDEEKKLTTHHHCMRATRGEAPPRLAGVSKLEDAGDWRGRDGESDFDHSMRLLETYAFEFKDMGLARDESHLGRVMVRRKLLKMVRYIAAAQDSAAHRTAILTLGRSAVNSIEYEAPRNWFYVLLGSATEVGASLLPWDWKHSWARIHVAVQTKNLFSLITQDTTQFQFSPMAGGELHLLFMTTPLFQPMLGVRGGYQFSTVDGLGFGDCDASDSDDDKRNCSQPVISPYIVLAVLERLRLQASMDIYPVGSDFDAKSYDILFGIGAHFF